MHIKNLTLGNHDFNVFSTGSFNSQRARKKKAGGEILRLFHSKKVQRRPRRLAEFRLIKHICAEAHAWFNTNMEFTDQDLVRKTLSDPNSYALLMERYEAPLRRYVRRLGCTDSHEADDILQETFIKCYLNLNGYDASLKFSSWLYRIVHNETISLFRKKRVRPFPVVNEEDLRIFEQVPEEHDFLDALIMKQDGVELQNALTSVQEKYRQILVLRFFEDKSYTEISDILQIPEGTVGTYIARGKAELKEILLQKRTTVKL